jgi:phytoene synthase
MSIRLKIKPHASPADVAACRASLRGGSKTFFAASLALPHAVRQPAAALYAFCRMADDAIDQGPNHEAALLDLHRRLALIYSGAPADIAADRAFADCALHFAIPRHFPLALLEGFEWDAIGRRYEDLPALRSYGVRVAGTVGAMMTMVMNVRERELVARACDLGVAMQFTNIARDVGEDARAGRLYLPLQWMREAGLDPDAWLARPVFCGPLARVIERLLAEAEALYERSDAGLAQLPHACRPGMYAARLLYAEIGHEVARRGFDSVSQRAVVPWHRKARILADAWVAAQRQAPAVSFAALAEGELLLDAIAPRSVVPAAPRDTVRELARWPRIEDRVVWLVDLFERLERRDRATAETANLS